MEGEYVTVGMLVKLARVESGLTQRNAAKMARVTANYLSLVENDRREPSLSLLERLAQLYGKELVVDLQRKGA